MESEKTVQPLDIMGLVFRFIKAFRQLWAVVLILVVGFTGIKWFMAWRSYVPYYQANAVLPSAPVTAPMIFSPPIPTTTALRLSRWPPPSRI